MAFGVLEFGGRVDCRVPAAEGEGYVEKVLHEGAKREAFRLAGGLPLGPRILSSRDSDCHKPDNQHYFDRHEKILGRQKRTTDRAPAAL